MKPQDRNLCTTPGNNCRGIVCDRSTLAVLDTVSKYIWSRIGLPNILLNHILPRLRNNETPDTQ